MNNNVNKLQSSSPECDHEFCASEKVEVEFKKCPFCGADAEMQYDLGIYTVQCNGCGVFGPTFDDWHTGENAWSDAKNAWNQRFDKVN